MRILPNITKLFKGKDGNTWKAEIVDHNRDPLEEKVFYHVSCGEFYNYVTIKMRYQFQTAGGINEQLLDQLQNQACLNCGEPFEKRMLRICFTQSAKLDSAEKQEFANLESLSMYSQDT